MHIYGNIIDGSTSGGVFVNGGGNVTIENNIILDGRCSLAFLVALLMTL